MNPLALIPLLSLSLAYGDIHPGRLIVTSFEDEAEEKNIKIDHDNIRFHRDFSIFDYNWSGSLRATRTGKFLAIKEDGTFGMDDQPFYGFRLHTPPESRSVRTVSYNGTQTFFLCVNDTLSYSWCEGAQQVLVVYEDLPRPRGISHSGSWKQFESMSYSELLY